MLNETDGKKRALSRATRRRGEVSTSFYCRYTSFSYVIVIPHGRIGTKKINEDDFAPSGFIAIVF